MQHSNVMIFHHTFTLAKKSSNLRNLAVAMSDAAVAGGDPARTPHSRGPAHRIHRNHRTLPCRSGESWYILKLTKQNWRNSANWAKRYFFHLSNKIHFTIWHHSAPPLLVGPGRDGLHPSRLLPLTLFVVHGTCVLRRDVQDVRLRHIRRQRGSAAAPSQQVFFRSDQLRFNRDLRTNTLTTSEQGWFYVILPRKRNYCVSCFREYLV